jgi:hypothetical protein
MDTLQKLSTRKFSNIETGLSQEASEDQVIYSKLIKFIWKLAWQYYPVDVLMEPEEVASELLEELAKGLKTYAKMDDGEPKLNVMKTILRNRVSELRHRYYGTHRKLGQGTKSIESDAACESLTSNEPTPEHYLAAMQHSMDRVMEVRSRLTNPVHVKVFDCLVLGQGDERLTNILLVHTQRQYAVFANPTIRIKPWMVSQALCITETEAQAAFTAIRKLYNEVLDAH